jgi:hypothetical protein
MHMPFLGLLAKRTDCSARLAKNVNQTVTLDVRRPVQPQTETDFQAAEKAARFLRVLHHRHHREKNGLISHKHGNLRVGTLRRIYGQSFAASQSPNTTLYELLELLGASALSEMHLQMLQQDYDDGLLERKVKKIIYRR